MKRLFQEDFGGVQGRRVKENEDRLKACLAQAMVGVGELYCFDRVESTMDAAFALNRTVDRTVIVSREQVQGRGRYSRPWYSESGGLYASVLLTEFDPAIPYSMLTSLALLQVIRRFGASVTLKWINDVLSRNGRKIAGVLTEEREGCTVIGIGVNVNNREFPHTLQGHATSLFLETGREIDVIDLFCSILETFFPILNRAHEGGIEELLADWEREAALRGRSVKLVGEFDEIRGVVRGINRRNGALILSVGDELREIYEGSLIYEE